MNPSLPKILTLALLIALQSITAVAINQDIQLFDQESEEVEDELEVSRVARLSFIEGDVSFLRAGVTEWADAVENLPLLAGDQIYAGERSRAEIQLGRGNYIRLTENTALTITDLSDEAAQFEVTEGIAIIRVERFPTIFKRFELNTPNAALILKQDGLYRVNVQGQDYSEVIARRGSMEVSTLDGNFNVREGNRLLVDTSPGGKLEIAADTSTDDWDRWSYDRDTFIDRSTIAISPDYVDSYETTYDSFYGASELSNYGTWTNISSYGDCWIPRVNSGWAPYRNGQWLWIPAAGWTWLAREPWGWAPYHYGRWSFINGFGWAWVPGFRSRQYNYNNGYYRWRPALVSFFDCPTPRGQYVGWYPLAPGERWRRPDRRRRDRSRLDYPSARNGWRRPGDGRFSDGVTILPVDGFTRPDRSGARPQAPGRDLREWVSRRAQPGLPELTPSHTASAPAWRRDGSRARRAVKPPSEVINRPVVVRNRPAGSQVAVNPPRERRLIVPRKEKRFTEADMPKRRGEAEADSGTSAPVRTEGRQSLDERNRRRERADQTPRLAIPNETGGDNTRARQKRNGSDQQPSSDASQNTGNTRERAERKQERADRKERPEPRSIPAPETRKNDSSNDRPRRDEAPARENKPPAVERSRPPKEERPKSNNDAPAKSRSDSAPKTVEPRRERAKPSSEIRKTEIQIPVRQKPSQQTQNINMRHERVRPKPEIKTQVRQEQPTKQKQQRREGRKKNN